MFSQSFVNEEEDLRSLQVFSAGAVKVLHNLFSELGKKESLALHPLKATEE